LSFARPSRRVDALPQQFFARLVRIAGDMATAGIDVINLGQGNPDQPTPAHIVEALCIAAQDPVSHRYCPFSGIRELKDAAVHWYRERFGVELDPEDEICIMIGSKIGLQEISLCLLEEGDVCLMPDPGYPDYWSGVVLAGGVSHRMPLLESNGYLPDYAAIPREVLHRARLMFLNYPTNPTGAVASAEFFAETVTFARRHELVVAHDLAYGDLVYDGRRPLSFLQTPGAIEVGVEFCTLSKSYNMAGWRVGFAAGNRDLIRLLNVIQDHLNCSQFAAVQRAAAVALTGPQDSVRQLRDLYETRRDTWVRACDDIGWNVTPSAGSFFVWNPVPKGYTAASFAERLLREAHIVTAPGVGFGTAGEGYIRTSLCAPAHRLEEATRRIGNLGVF
jgi:L-glutamine---4-(methylsulfanyl)-2-oxobutanoate aminotransferase